MTDAEIVQLVRAELDNSQGYDDNYLGDLRARSLDYYQGNTQSSSIPTAAAGRSNIVSMDVHDTVNSLLAEIIPMMSTSIIQFPAMNAQDEPASQMESDFVKDDLDKNGFEQVAYDASHSGLLQGLGWIKIDTEEATRVTNEVVDYPVTDPIEYDVLSSPRTPGEQVAIKVNPDSTQITRETPYRRLKVECTAPENVVFSLSRGQYDTEELRFVGERRVFTLDELVQDFDMTPDDAASIPDHNDDYWPGAIARRDMYYADSLDSDGAQNQTKMKECFNCYLHIAMEEKGPTQLYFLMIGGNHLIKHYPVPFHPWVNGSPIPMPHRTQGRGMYETMKDIQEGKTDLLRSLIDNASVANGSRTAYNENTVNVGHLTNGRINGVVAVNGMPAEHIMQMPASDITGHIAPVLQYLDEVRSSRGGASVDMNNAEMQTAKTSAEAAYNVKVSKEKMAGFYARNMVNSLMKGVYLKAHQTMRYYLNGPKSAKIRGQWTQTDPSLWPERLHCVVTCGLTEVERRQKIQNLTMLTERLMQLNQSGAGGILTDISKVYNSLADWVRVANIGKPEEYLLDPLSQESQQVQQENAVKAEQQMNQARDMLQLQQAMGEMKIELDKYKHDTELKFKYWKEGVESGENTQDNVTQVTVAKIQQETNEQRSQTSQ
ncbi:MAG: hypothetical protein ACERKS_12010 [Candidatus Bathyarchaeota archaeon]